MNKHIDDLIARTISLGLVEPYGAVRDLEYLAPDLVATLDRASGQKGGWRNLITHSLSSSKNPSGEASLH